MRRPHRRGRDKNQTSIRVATRTLIVELHPWIDWTVSAALYGKALLGPTWHLQLSFDKSFDFWRVHIGREAENEDYVSRDHYLSSLDPMFGWLNIKGTLDQAVSGAKAKAVTEEVLQLLARRLPVSKLSSDLLKLWLEHTQEKPEFRQHAIHNHAPFSDEYGSVLSEIRRRERKLEERHNWGGVDPIRDIKQRVRDAIKPTAFDTN